MQREEEEGNHEKKREEEECHDNQRIMQKQGFCCHAHAKKMKRERKEEIRKKKVRVNRAEHCIHCNEEPCIFIQIKFRLCENNAIYYDEGECTKTPVVYNSARHKHMFQYAAFILWEGINTQLPQATLCMF
jgi:hypothetical protein